MRLLCLPIVVSSLLTLIQNKELSDVRQLYRQAGSSKNDARRLQQLLSKVDSNSSPLLYCYKGASEMIQAKYALNPMNKLARFSSGKSWISRAESRDTSDIEMRFIRFSVQSNLPAFLGYRQDINRDKIFLKEHLKDVDDMELKKMIVNYLNTFSDLTTVERNGRNN